MSDELFARAELVSVAPEVPPKPNEYPYFLVAYWPAGGYWSVKAKDTWSDPDGIHVRAAIRDLQTRGWKHVTVCKLPELP